MAQGIKAVRGMNDLLPGQTEQWHQLEALLMRVARQFGFSEIRPPIMEKTDVFSRPLGTTTDVVHKEMYSFEDRNGDSLSLRPEGTAGCMRAVIEHNLTYGQVQRLYYMGPMFRYEAPQKGRYRQFHHFGLEAVGMSGHEIEVELIVLMTTVLRALGILDQLELQINSLGTAVVRRQHKEALVAYFTKHQDRLDEDSLKRLTSNPLRILDSKNPVLSDLIQAAPTLMDYFDEESRQHFEQLCQLLDELGIAYTVNPCLVRGLDYYCHTVFEWVSSQLGAQGAVCGGGRYDGLMKQLGGRDTPAVGLAMGIERLLLLSEDFTPPSIDIYIVYDAQAASKAFSIAEKMRDKFTQLRIMTHGGGGGFKAQFKQAHKLGATLAVIVGRDEIKQHSVSVKLLGDEQTQTMVNEADLLPYIEKILSRG
jgi:histidyl-tRNA synthetase